MIDKIENNQLRDILEKYSARQHDPQQVPADSEGDASLQADYACLIEKAKQAPQTDQTAVERARDLLLSGRLESPQNIRAAAENIINFGI